MIPVPAPNRAPTGEPAGANDTGEVDGAASVGSPVRAGMPNLADYPELARIDRAAREAAHRSQQP